MTLASRIQADAERISSTDAFGESLVYRHAAGGTSTITAPVHRAGLVSDQDGNRVRRRAELFVPRSATVGVTSVVDGDSIDIPWEIGAAAETARIVDIIERDVGGWLLAVEG